MSDDLTGSHVEHVVAAGPSVVVFDVGEVLIDETRVWSIWADIIGVSPLTFGAVLGAAIAQGEDWPAVFPHLAPNIDWHEHEEEHERRYDGFQERDLYADVRPCLEALMAAGRKVVIAGNQPARRKAQLEALALPCDWLATSEDLGAEKPSTDFWEILLEHLDLDDGRDVLYVGDRIDNDIDPAATHGFATCWLQRGPWGQLQDLPDGLEPDLVLEGLAELPLLLDGWDVEESS